MTSQPSPHALKLKSGEGGDSIAPALSVSPKQGPRSIYPRVFTRLQSLLPSFSISQPPAAPTISSASASSPPLSLFFKTRIITWNMHDSLPKGNLEELLGSISLHTPRSVADNADRLRIPGLSLLDDHPYHIVVVAGQECPTLSGIPLGLAANFKHRDSKDRDKDEDKHRERDGDKNGDKDFLQPTTLKTKLSKHQKHDHTPHNGSLETAHGFPGLDRSSSHNLTTTPGWSAVLEDWFANGANPVLTTTKNPAASSSSSSVNKDKGPHTTGSGHNLRHKPLKTMGVDGNPDDASTDANSSPPVPDIKARSGSYELLVKDRLMGIYMAVYIHRDVKPMVQGFSSGVVPAGLIGGRLGNKGGVGVSMNLNGTTLLFINAHLAAHEGKVPLRVANLAKIKAELPLESWLSPNDPRTLAEDLTDRFDHSWIFGDLNFRLDISRLHADWLISRKEYSQAFEFDQLHKLMESGDSAFSGFQEAKIDFPPTFKYDVVHTLKRDKHRLHKHRKDNNPEEENNRTDGFDHEGDEDDDSLHSSACSSIHSVHLIDPPEARESKYSPPTSPPGLTQSPQTGIMTRVALRIRVKWLAFFESSLSSSPDSPRARKRTSMAMLRPLSSIEPSRHANPYVKALPSASSLGQAASAKTPLVQQSLEVEDVLPEGDKGVYDSSSKQRVPSWCDRILWKSTIAPEAPPHLVRMAPEQAPSGRSRHRFIRAFHPQKWRKHIHPRFSAGRPKSPKSPGDTPKSDVSQLSTAVKPSDDPALSLPPESYNQKSSERPISFDESQLPSRNPSARAGASRRQSVPLESRSSRPMPVPRRAVTDQSIRSADDCPTTPASPVVPAARIPTKRWFFNLLSRDTAAPSSLSGNNATTLQPDSSPPQHRKGDVVCLSYRTLDDHQMKRLEGRSDHRPVIGSFAIYI